MSTQSVPLVTPEEYLAYDRASEVKNEYVFGEIVSMAGASPWHSLLAANALGVFYKQLSGGKCRVFDSSLRVCLDQHSSYAYPDVTVVCGVLEYVDEKKDTAANPKVIVEVLSPTTRNYDLGDKARMYSRIPSLTDLLLIAQDRVSIEHWRRLPNGHWEIGAVEDRQASIQIESVACALSVAEIYAGVELP